MIHHRAEKELLKSAGSRRHCRGQIDIDVTVEGEPETL